jgi:hypothetical protein
MQAAHADFAAQVFRKAELRPCLLNIYFGTPREASHWAKPKG